MANIEQAKTALRNAHQAGDVESARKLAQYIQSQSVPEEPTLGEQLQERGITAMQEVAADKPAVTLPYRLATQVGGAAGDIAGAGLSAITPDVIEDPIKEYAGKAAKYLSGTKAGQAIGKGVELAQEHAPDVVDIGKGAMSMAAMPVGAQVATAPVRKVTSAAVTPNLPEEALNLAKIAKKYEVPLSLPQISDSRALANIQKISQEVPFAGVEKFRDKQLSKWQEQLFRTAGVKADKFTPENMNFAFKKVGSEFDKLTKGKNFQLSDSAMNQLTRLEDDVIGGVYGLQGQTLLKRHTDELFQKLDNNTISGEQLSKYRNKLSRISRAGSNLEAQQLAKDFENVLVDIIGDDAPKALQQAKYRYKNLIALEPLAKKAKKGNISPALLNNRVGQIYGRQHTIGQSGDIGELARLGYEALGELGGSDTFQKGMYAGGSVVGLSAAPATTASVIGGNRALQALYLRNPKLIERAVEKAVKRKK